MGTPTQPPNVAQANFQPAVSFGGTLAGTPQPNEPFYPLRCDQFLTLRDGEMSGPRSMRDICIGAPVTGVFAIASLLATLDWDSALKQGRHPVGWTVILGGLTLAALLTVLIAQLLMSWTRNRSAYSRVVQTIEGNLSIEPQRPFLFGWFSRRRPARS
jgi:hypothetical protein